jgi:hypothetical protein
MTIAEKRAQHIKRAVSLKGFRSDISSVEGFNAKLAVAITKLVGSMACAYAFCVLALIGLPKALSSSGEGIIAWVAQTFLQLVLLSIIIVGQNISSVASDARADSTWKDTELICDRLDTDTDGGLKAVIDRIDKLETTLKS